QRYSSPCLNAIFVTSLNLFGNIIIGGFVEISHSGASRIRVAGKSLICKAQNHTQKWSSSSFLTQSSQSELEQARHKDTDWAALVMQFRISDCRFSILSSSDKNVAPREFARGFSIFSLPHLRGGARATSWVTNYGYGVLPSEL